MGAPIPLSLVQTPGPRLARAGMELVGPVALGRYLAGTGRQFGADLNGEVQVRLP
jgi:hypothetical protein